MEDEDALYHGCTETTTYPYHRPPDTRYPGRRLTLQTDGDGGDGQGGRFWAEQHRPKGEAPFKRAAGEKKFGP